MAVPVSLSRSGSRGHSLRRHVLPALGDRAISSIRPSGIRALVRKLSDGGMASGSVRNVFDFASRLFRSAAEDRLITSTPCRRITLPRLDEVEAAPPTTARVVAVVDGVDARYRALVVLLAGSGLRIGEALGLASGYGSEEGGRFGQAGPVGARALVRRHHVADVRPPLARRRHRTRSVMDATLGILRTGCGLEDLEQGSVAGQ